MIVTKDIENYAESIKNAIIKAVNADTENIKNVGVLFSSGLDSSIIAKVCEILDKKITLYCVGTSKSKDFEYATKAIAYIDADLKIIELNDNDIEKLSREVVNFIPQKTPMDISIAVGVYAACKVAEENVVLSGQGADELFAGYHRYLRMNLETLNDVLKKDFEKLIKNDLVRDSITAKHAGKILKAPYTRISEIAFNIPPQYKIFNGKRKYILRIVGKNLGLPEFIYEREKKAMQYSTGIEKVVKRLIKDKKLKIPI